MSAYPKISIVTVSYNQGAYLEKTLRSVIDQGYPNLEYIVIDGGSTDESPGIIRKHEKHLAYWVSEKDRGQSHALNKGFARCTGDILGWLNSDDYFLPGALERFAEAWRNDPKAGGWVGDAALVDPRGQVIRVQAPGRLDAASLAQWAVNGFSQPACLFSKDAWSACGPIDESLHIAMDFDLWMKIALKFPFRRVSGTLAGALAHPAAKTQSQKSRMRMEIWAVQMRHGFEDVAWKNMHEVLDELLGAQARLERLVRSPLYRLAQPVLDRLLR